MTPFIIPFLITVVLFLISIGMADVKLQADHGFQTSWRGGKVPLNSEIANVRTNGSAIKIGHVVTHTGETYPDVAPAVTTDRRALGVVNAVQNLVSVLADTPDWDMDDAVPDNMEIEVYKLGCGAVMAMIFEDEAVSLVKGDLVALSGEGGVVRQHLYTDSTEATDTMVEVIGTCYEAFSGDATDDKMILVELNV